MGSSVRPGKKRQSSIIAEFSTAMMSAAGALPQPSRASRHAGRAECAALSLAGSAKAAAQARKRRRDRNEWAI